jgi:hypothetical protein
MFSTFIVIYFINRLMPHAFFNQTGYLLWLFVPSLLLFSWLRQSHITHLFMFKTRYLCANHKNNFTLMHKTSYLEFYVSLKTQNIANCFEKSLMALKQLWLLELPLSWHEYPRLPLCQHLEPMDNLPAKSEVTTPVHCYIMYSTFFKYENVKINTLRTGILKNLSRQAYYSKIHVTLTFDTVT